VTTQPSLSAAIIAALGLTGAEEAFEVGTGYGYQTALLARLAARVVSGEQLQAQLDQISTRAEVDEELARLRERLAAGADQRHRTVPHTADLRIEA